MSAQTPPGTLEKLRTLDADLRATWRPSGGQVTVSTEARPYRVWLTSLAHTHTLTFRDHMYTYVTANHLAQIIGVSQASLSRIYLGRSTTVTRRVADALDPWVYQARPTRVPSATTLPGDIVLNHRELDALPVRSVVLQLVPSWPLAFQKSKDGWLAARQGPVASMDQPRRTLNTDYPVRVLYIPAPPTPAQRNRNRKDSRP